MLCSLVLSFSNSSLISCAEILLWDVCEDHDTAYIKLALVLEYKFWSLDASYRVTAGVQK